MDRPTSKDSVSVANMIAVSEEKYNKVLECPGYYLAEPTVQSNFLALESED